MFRASLCPSSREQRPCYCIWCVVLVLLDVVGSGCGGAVLQDVSTVKVSVQLLNMFRTSLCPSSGDQRPCYCIWCVVLVLLDVVGSGFGALSCRMWALSKFLFNFSTCFGHHYAHLQENKGPVSASGVFWFCWMWLVAVVGRCLAGCEHYESFCSTSQHVSGIIMPIFRRTKALLLYLVCCSGSAGCSW